MQLSVWNATCSLPSFPPLEGDRAVDVLMIGGGLPGLLTAFFLEQAGVDYLLIDAQSICHGISGNTTAKITSQHGLLYAKLLRSFGAETARAYWEAHQSALEAYRKLAQTFPCDFQEEDSFVYSRNSGEDLSRELAALRHLAIPGEFEKDLPLPFPTAGAVKFKGQAQFHPLKFAASIAKNLKIREHTTALSWNGTSVSTNRGTITPSRIVVTTHFPIFNKHGGYFVKMHQERSYVLALEHAPFPGGMYVDKDKHGFSFRRYGDLLLVGGSSHRTGSPSDGWTGLESFAKTHYPNARVKYRWAAQDCITLDGMPYIGQYGKNTPNLYTATGFNKWGMTSSMLAATLLRDAILNVKNPYAPIFAPSRSPLRPKLFLNAAASAVNLLTPTKPRCPHLGCALKWNPHERSWDCPCHGSRFAADGQCLNAPATADLPRENFRNGD